MFTGIIQHRGTVNDTVAVEFGRRFAVDASGWEHQPKRGESICVSGTCLTVTSHDGMLAFDVIAQTLRCTTLGELQPGDPVNLESCVTPDTLLSGHIVQGHVDGVGEVIDRKEGADEVRLGIRPPADLMKYMVPKGSVATDGVSMTLAEVLPDSFELALIPTTLEITTLGLVKVGSKVNIEADILVKTIAHLMKQMQADNV